MGNPSASPDSSTLSQSPEPLWRSGAGLLVVVVCAGAIYGHWHDRFWWPPDDGAYAYVADRVVQGDVLNRDVQAIHMGHIHFVNAAALWLFGDDFLSLRYPLAAIGVGLSVMVFLLLRQQGVLMAVGAGVAASSLSIVQYFNPTANWYCLILFLGMICWLNWKPAGSCCRLEVTGLLLSTIFQFRQLTGVIAAIGVIAYLLIEQSPQTDKQPTRGPWLARLLSAVMTVGLGFYLWSKTSPLYATVNLVSLLLYGTWSLGLLLWTCFNTRMSNLNVIKMLLKLAVGGVIGFIPLVGYHAANGSLGIWIDDTIMGAISLSELNFYRRVSYAGHLSDVFLLGLGSITDIPILLNTLYWSMLFLLPVGLGACLLWSCVWKKSQPKLLPFMAVIFGTVSLHLQIPTYMMYSLCLTIAAVAWMAADGRPIVKAGVWGGVIYLSAVGLIFQAGQPLSRGYDGVFSGTRKELIYSEGLPHCSLWIEPDVLQEFQQIVEIVDREVAPEESILVLPFDPEIHFLTKRRTPARFFNSALALTTDEDLQQFQEKLRSDPPRLVIMDRFNKYVTSHTHKLMNSIEADYRFLESTRHFQVFENTAAGPRE